MIGPRRPLARSSSFTPRRVLALGGALCLVAVMMVLAASAADDDVSAQIARGKKIYMEGRDPDATVELKARIGGENGVDVPAWSLPCATCHGANGEGGLPGQEILPPDVRTAALATAYESEAGRRRPAYTSDAAIVRAIAKGKDAAGQTLSSIMPRYTLTEAQGTALITYLRSLDPADSETP